MLLVWTAILCNLALADTPNPVVIAVIDTGIDTSLTQAKLCKTGHADFTQSPAVIGGIPYDTHGHGSNVAELIHRNAAKAGSNYCLAIIKYYKDGASSKETLANSNEALKFAASINPSIVNYSGGGPVQDPVERKVVAELLNNKAYLVFAAGNEGADLSVSPYYPASYDDRIIVVGNLLSSGQDGNLLLNPSSNYGSKVTVWEAGTHICAAKRCLTGTSQATAIVSGKLAAKLMIDRLQ